jgi:hypothetical protein
MILETTINGWNNKIVQHKQIIYPQTLDENTPKNFFLAIFCGSRGSGKTYLLSKLLKTLEEKKIYENGNVIPQRIILICSTAHSDSNRIFKSLKNLDWDNDVIDDYSEIQLINKMEELKNELELSKEYKLYKIVYQKFKSCKDIDELEIDEMLLLNKYEFTPFNKLPKIKYPDGFILHYIVDDMLGTNIFKNGRSVFTNLCIRNRHITPSNIIISTQAMMMIPKTIRLNANLIVMFKFANKQSILDDIYPTISSYITEDEFKELYDYATTEAHSALVIDHTNNKIQFKKNFDKLLTFNTVEASSKIDN